MLKVNSNSDNAMLIEIRNEAPEEGFGVQHKNVGIFLKPSTDYSSITTERNVSASQDYLNILKDSELKITDVVLESAPGRSPISVPNDGIAFTFENGDRYKTKISLIQRETGNIYSILPVGGVIKVTLGYTGTLNKRISIEVESGGTLPVEEP